MTAAGEQGTLDMRAACPEDCRFVFDLQTQAGARRYMRDPRTPDWETHRAWFARRIASPDGTFLILETGEGPVGMLRCDPLAPGREEISILIDERVRARGLGSAFLSLLRRRRPGVTLVAEIHSDNVASRRAFAAAGFREESGGVFVAEGGEP